MFEISKNVHLLSTDAIHMESNISLIRDSGSFKMPLFKDRYDKYH